jgi:hypothetical protein
MSDAKVKVLYLTGFGRSGSTILGNILGQIDGFFHIGEVYSLWYDIPIGEMPCGCGIPLRRCTVWKKILHNAFGGIEQIDAHEMLRLHASGTRPRHIPLMLMPWGKEALRFRLGKYLDTIENLYQAIQSITNSKVIVDSSKHPSYGYILGMMPGIDLYVLQLIRDSRAVAYSWLRRKLRPETGKYITQYSSLKSSLQWSLINLASELLWRDFSEQYSVLRYEDFIKSPLTTLTSILNLVHENAPDLPFMTNNMVKIGLNHTVFGNPNRTQTGNIVLQLDDEWVLNMRARDRILATLLTWPLLIRYKYPFRMALLN